MLLGVVLLGTAACGAAPTGTPPVTPTAIVPSAPPTADLSKTTSKLCVVTPQEAVTAFGKQLTDFTTADVTEAYCGYHVRASTAGGDDSLFLRPESGATFASMKADGGIQPLTGVGDEAYVHDATATAVTLLLRKGGSFERIEVYSPDLGRDGLVHIATQVAGSALSRL